ncbi:MAG: RNA polymerase sigma-70 factor [Nocardioidaceae bacterium]
MTDLALAHDDLRPLMFSIAYRMLGSVAEAEDVVQDAFLRMHKATAAGATIETPDAFATTVTTRVAIDALRSAQARRETYIGPWLPEPILDDDPAHRVELDETVSIAFLVVLERLSPVERAVFLLREVFGYAYPEIAAVVEKSEANCRQLLVRAKRHLESEGPRFATAERRDEIAAQFFAALRTGDLAALERVLVDDITFYGDGGGKAPAIRRPLAGLVAVARFLRGLGRQAERLSAGVREAQVNGQPGAVLTDRNGDLIGVLALDIAEDGVRAIRNQINPDKLQHLGTVGDINSLTGGDPAP